MRPNSNHPVPTRKIPRLWSQALYVEPNKTRKKKKKTTTGIIKVQNKGHEMLQDFRA